MVVGSQQQQKIQIAANDTYLHSHVASLGHRPEYLYTNSHSTVRGTELIVSGVLVKFLIGEN